MKTESELRALIKHEINLGVSEERARNIVAEYFPDYCGEILSVAIEQPESVKINKTEFEELLTIDEEEHEFPTEDLDVSTILDEPSVDYKVDLTTGLLWPKAVVQSKEPEEKLVVVKSEPRVKRKYNSHKGKMRKIFQESDNKYIGHIVYLYMMEFNLSLMDAYNNALIIMGALPNPGAQYP